MSGQATSSASAPRGQNAFHLQQAFKLALSLVLFYWLALWMNWDLPHYGALAIVIVSLGTTGATIEKGLARFIGTTAGVAVGFLVLALFCHDRWATMLAFALYVAVIGYFMQASRNSYAWYVAAFVPLVVWGDNYPHFNNAFYFGMFRWLETTVGIAVYTTVDLVLWPRQAGDLLNQQGERLWAEVRELFQDSCQQRERGGLSESTAQLHAKLAGTLSRTASTLQNACTDTPDIQARKRVWERLGANARALVDALELWREGAGDCRQLDLDSLLPELRPALDTLNARLARLGALWQQRQADSVVPCNDRDLLASIPNLALADSAGERLTHWQRAALLALLEQLQDLDRISCELLRDMRVLAGLESRRGSCHTPVSRDMFRGLQWDPQRFTHALFPSAAFIAAYFLWIFMSPPTGAKVPMMAGILALVILRTPMNPMGLLVVLLLSTFLFVAPIYWLVMPGLNTGFGLLGLVFVYSFVFGYLGGRSPALKSGPIIMFATMTGISNHQNYSFNGPVDGALMVLLAGLTVTTVYFLFAPMRAEQVLLGSLRRFFSGCARATAEFTVERDKGAGLRRRLLESTVLPAPAKIQAAREQLDWKRYPRGTPEKLQRLEDGVQCMVYRLQSLETSSDRFAEEFTERQPPLSHIGERVRDTLSAVLKRWANFDLGAEDEAAQRELQALSHDLEQQFKAFDSVSGQDVIGEQFLARLYAILGNARGLAEAMNETRCAISDIDWKQFATARFY